MNWRLRESFVSYSYVYIAPKWSLFANSVTYTELLDHGAREPPLPLRSDQSQLLDYAAPVARHTSPHQHLAKLLQKVELDILESHGSEANASLTKGPDF